MLSDKTFQEMVKRRNLTKKDTIQGYAHTLEEFTTIIDKDLHEIIEV